MTEIEVHLADRWSASLLLESTQEGSAAPPMAAVFVLWTTIIGRTLW